VDTPPDFILGGSAVRSNLVSGLFAVIVVVAGVAAGVSAGISGADAASPKFLISPTSFDFGAQPLHSPSPQQLVTIKNVSGAPIVMSGAGGGAGVFGGSQDCQGLTIAAGASCHMYYQFTPTALGATTGSTGGNWNGQTFSFSFKGTGTPQFRISPTAFDFGDVPVGTTSTQQLVTITNLGSTSVVMSGAGGGAGQFGGSQDCQGLTITAGNSCHMYYQFHPTSIGAATGSTGGNWNGQPFSFAFTGNGTAAATGDYVPVAATRIFDTRNNTGYFGGKPKAGETVQLFAASGAVPGNAVAADLTVSAVSEAGAGSVTVWPCGSTRPAFATMFFQKGVTIANHVNAQLGTNGAVCFRATVGTHLVADLDGYYPNTTGYHPVAGTRVLDTRNHIGFSGAKPAAGKVIQVKVTGGSVPVGAGAVALNISATQEAKVGNLSVYPCGVTRPAQQAVSYHKNITISALAVSKVGSGGKVCIRTSKSTHVVADVKGWYASATSFTAITPQRVLDTRGHAKPAAGHISAIKVTSVGAANIPVDARAVVLDITAAAPAAIGHITLYPCGAAVPTTTVVNYVKDTTITDLAVGSIGTNGSVCIKSSASSHLIVDVVGWYGA
jgi:hypothetical protein